MITLYSLLLLVAVPCQGTQQTERPPLGRFLRQIEEIDEASGVALDNSAGLWALEQDAGRLWRVEADGSRNLLAEGLHAPRDIQFAADGSLFVSESKGWGVAHLARDGSLLGRLGQERLLRAAGLALAGEQLFVTDSRRQRVEVFGLDGEYRFGFGEHGQGPGQLVAPSDVACDSNGAIYVTDTGNSRVQVFDAKGKFLRAWGDWGPYPGLFFKPGGIEVRGDEVFVADTGNHRVQVFSLQGQLLERFGLHAIRPREGHGNLHYPTALALSPDGEFAALSEPWGDRVQIFCRSAGTAENAVRRQAAQLAKPSSHFGMYLAAEGPYLFVSEPESHSIVVYENTADEPRRISRLGGLGQKTGLLTAVAGMHYERSTRDLWVCDPILRRLSLFRLRGSEEDEVGFDSLLGIFVKSLDLERLHELVLHKWLPEVPEPVAVERDGAGRFYLLERRNPAVILLSAQLEVLDVFGMDQLQDPTALAVTTDGQHLFVVDAVGALWRFDGAERTPRKLVTLAHPYGLALSEPPAGSEKKLELFVTERSTHRILRLNEDGQLQKSWGGKGILRGELYKPRGLAVDFRGHVWVIDHGNHRLVSFDADGVYQSIFGPRLYTRLARYPEFANKQEEQ